jgi:hypothetical protein
MPKSKKPGDQRLREPLPALDDDVEESTSDQDDSSTSRQNDVSTDRAADSSTHEAVDTSTSRQSESSTQSPASDPPVTDTAEEETEPADAPTSRLRQQLMVLMESVDLPADAPRMTEKTNAHISGDADDRLREAVRVLETRYGKGFSKSLLVEYILRGALWDLRENAEDSQIVRVLDRIFDA